jgi:hypothetical protein
MIQVIDMTEMTESVVRQRHLRHLSDKHVLMTVLVLLLPLHSSVLEPDLDLSFAQAKRVSDLDASPASQISIEMKLFLQFQRLISGVGSSLSFRFTDRIDSVRCLTKHKNILISCGVVCDDFSIKTKKSHDSEQEMNWANAKSPKRMRDEPPIEGHVINYESVAHWQQKRAIEEKRWVSSENGDEDVACHRK